MSRRLFGGLFPRWPEAEVPVGHVTNGVHVPSWDSPGIDALWEEACGKERWRGALEAVSEPMRCVTDQRLWETKARDRERLVQSGAEQHGDSSWLGSRQRRATRRRNTAPYWKP